MHSGCKTGSVTLIAIVRYASVVKKWPSSPNLSSLLMAALIGMAGVNRLAAVINWFVKSKMLSERLAKSELPIFTKSLLA